MTPFYGYQSESQMRKHNPILADQLIMNAKKIRSRVATRGKKCTGEINGVFRYADGSKDSGQVITIHEAEMGGCRFKW
jgi:hypothetical protein